MPPKHSSSKNEKRSVSMSMSKQELKIALITKRLAMLQDDDDNDDHQPIPIPIPIPIQQPVSVDTPISYERRRKRATHTHTQTTNEIPQNTDTKFSASRVRIHNNTCGSQNPLNHNRSMVISDDRKLPPLVQHTQKKSPNSLSRKRLMVISDEEPEKDGKSQLLVQPTHHKSPNSLSRKRSIVISDDKSEKDANLQLLVQPTQQKRQKGTKRKRATSVDNSNDIPNAFDGQRNQKIKSAEPSDDSSSEKSSSAALKRAEEVRANLPAEYPSFVKMMLASHVCRVFWLHLPTKFCRKHLPKCDSIVKLIDEEGEISACNYLFKKYGLSGGWRAFSLKRKLNEGDVAVFQLIAPTTFKVYIVRKGGLDEFDGALGLLRLDDCKGHDMSEKIGDPEIPDSHPHNSVSPSRSNSDQLGPEVLDGICFADATINFDAVKDFDNFSIIVDGLVFDSKFPDASRKKYYELCVGQKTFLHEQLLKGLNCNLVIGIIVETVNIADGIRACTSATSIEDLQLWDNTLRGFEVLGMKVNFLRAKLNLMADESNGFEKCLAERAHAGEKMRGLENKLTKLKVVIEKINLEMEAEMTTSTQKLQSKLKQLANDPW